MQKSYKSLSSMSSVLATYTFLDKKTITAMISLEDFMYRTELLDTLLREERTGSPSELAKMLKISDRAVYSTINSMKEGFNAPIAYCKKRQTYYYTTRGRIIFGFSEGCFTKE